MYQAPRGTFDIFGSEYLLRQDVVDTLLMLLVYMDLVQL